MQQRSVPRCWLASCLTGLYYEVYWSLHGFFGRARAPSHPAFIAATPAGWLAIGKRLGQRLVRFSACAWPELCKKTEVVNMTIFSTLGDQRFRAFQAVRRTVQGRGKLLVQSQRSESLTYCSEVRGLDDGDLVCVRLMLGQWLCVCRLVVLQYTHIGVGSVV